MEGDLLARLKARDVRAQRQFRERHLRALTARCEPALGDRARAQEVAEDVIADLLLVHIDRVRTERALAAYLHVAALRRCRRLRSLLERHQELEERPDLGDGPEAALLRADEASRWSERIAWCMARLRPKVRAVLRLRFQEDATQEAIGEAMGVSKQYVGRVLAKALESLKRCLEGLP